MSKSKDMESNAWTEYGEERSANPLPLANPHRLPPGSDEQKQAIRHLEEHTKNQEAISARLHKKLRAADVQEDKETVGYFAWGCLLVPVVLYVLARLVYISATCCP